MNIYDTILSGKRKQFAVLIDPDKYTRNTLLRTISVAVTAKVDLFLVGGSLVMKDSLDSCINTLKDNCEIPVILFPGSALQVNPEADAILLLSLISGRNPELLIGQHVIAAPYIRSSGLEVLSTGYMLVESGNNTTAKYISNTQPIPFEKDDIAMCTAMAGEMLGFKLIYMDAGSGAERSVPVSMIKAVRASISIPLIVGGGIRTPEAAIERCSAGADIIVVGNALENDPGLITEIGEGIHSVK
jgi:putative glycerol-1-phosphate prenyltransferase